MAFCPLDYRYGCEDFKRIWSELGRHERQLEVERALIAHPNITEVATCAVEVKADVQLIAAFFTADQPLPEDDLNRFAALHLARYKQPRIWVQMDALPKGPNGKLSRRVLRETYAAQKGT